MPLRGVAPGRGRTRRADEALYRKASGQPGIDAKRCGGTLEPFLQLCFGLFQQDGGHAVYRVFAKTARRHGHAPAGGNGGIGGSGRAARGL